MGDRQPHDKIISLWFSANSFRPYSLGAKSLPLHFGRQEQVSFISRDFRSLFFLFKCITDVAAQLCWKTFSCCQPYYKYTDMFLLQVSV